MYSRPRSTTNRFHMSSGIATWANSIRMIALLLGTVGVLPAFLMAADPVSKIPEKEESWQVIYLSGQRIGYAWSQIDTFQVNNQPIVKTSSVTQMEIKRFGQTLNLKQTLTTEETVDGQLLMIRFENANPPAMSSVMIGKIQGNELALTQEVNGVGRTTTQPWKEGVKSPAWQDRHLKENPLKPGESRSFEMFIPDFAKVATTTLKGIKTEETVMLDKTSKSLFKVSSTNSLLPGISMDSYLDEKGEAVKVSTSLLGTKMEIFQVSKEVALKAIEGAELDLAVSTLVKVKPIARPHSTKRIVYKVKIDDGDPQESIPEGDTQSLKKIDKESAELTVVSIPLPRSARVGKVAEEFFATSQYLQKDDELVQKHAQQAAGTATDPAEIARRMEAYVHEKLVSKNFSTAMASAAEVARKLEGDCTEHAVLLAAMLRAKGIPSRVAVGLVYADGLSAFGGHMWTEANLDGKWIPLDATLGRGGIGAAHIKLANSSLSDDGPSAISGFAPLMTVIGKLKLEVVSVE